MTLTPDAWLWIAATVVGLCCLLVIAMIEEY